jgi:hypothetical protein
LLELKESYLFIKKSYEKIATIIAIVFFTSIGFAQNGAKIEFKAENNTIDYGTITKGRDNGIRVFEFTNGTTPLIIYAVQSTASSTVLSKQTDTVLPGKSSKIEVKYNMAVGPIRKQLLWNLMLLIMTEAVPLKKEK